jgi:hypothetical protein
MKGLEVSRPASSSQWSAVGASLRSDGATCGHPLIAEAAQSCSPRVPLRGATRRAGCSNLALQPTRAAGPNEQREAAGNGPRG